MPTKEASATCPSLTASSAGRTGVQLATDPDACALAGGTGDVPLQADLGREASNGIFEVQINRVMEILALRRSGLGGVPAPPEQIRKEVVNPAGATKVELAEVEAAAAASGALSPFVPTAERLVAELVILLPLGRVA
jgi:hypothetical protein